MQTAQRKALKLFLSYKRKRQPISGHKSSLLLSLSLELTLYNMALADKKNVTGWETWINRIVTIALAAYQAVQYLLTHWAAK